MNTSTKSTKLQERASIISKLGLPTNTTDEELAVILQANKGTSAPLASAVFPALVEFVLASTRLTEQDARQFVAGKFPSIAVGDAPVDEDTIPNNRPEFLKRLGLPLDTTDAELNVVLQANEGASLPLKKAVHTALLALAMRHDGLPEDEAREYIANKFPSLKPADAHTKPGAAAVADSLRRELIRLYGLPDDASETDIAAAAAAERNENIAERARRAQQEADEVAIAQKTKVGLTREQAIKTINRQRDHDAALVEQHAERRPRLVALIRESFENSPGSVRAARLRARDELSLNEGSEFYAALAEVQGK